MASKAKALSTKDAIARVLADNGKPMMVSQIFEAAMPLTNLSGATPKQTFYSILYAENKKPDGLFKRTSKPGTFKLAAKPAKAAAEKVEAEATA